VEQLNRSKSEQDLIIIQEQGEEVVDLNNILPSYAEFKEKLKDKK